MTGLRAGDSTNQRQAQQSVSCHSHSIVDQLTTSRRRTRLKTLPGALLLRDSIASRPFVISIWFGQPTIEKITITDDSIKLFICLGYKKRLNQGSNKIIKIIILLTVAFFRIIYVEFFVLQISNNCVGFINSLTCNGLVNRLCSEFCFTKSN